MRILIVDDEASMRDMLAQTIGARGEDFTVVGIAGSGGEAMERCRKLRPDVIITDICMPDVNGLEFLRALRDESLLAKTVIISGYDEFDYARKAISLGVTDYLLKPFLPGELLEVLERIKAEIEDQRVLTRDMDSLRNLADRNVQKQSGGGSLLGETSGGTARNPRELTDEIRQLKTGILLEVRLGNRQKALALLDKLMACYAALVAQRADYVFISAGALVYSIANELEERYGTLHSELLRRVEKMCHAIEYSDLAEKKNALESFVAASCEWVRSQERTSGSKRLVEQACALIDSELGNQELSLEWVAAHLNFSPHYVRQIFKQHMGEGFTDYVIRRRMEKAGTLLRTSGMLVQDAALMCGYANQRYFASSFKKYYGQTPTDYKQMADREKHEAAKE